MDPSRNKNEGEADRPREDDAQAGRESHAIGIDRWLIEVKRHDWSSSPSRRRLDAWTHWVVRAILRDDFATLSAAEEVFGHAQARWFNRMPDGAEAGEILGRLRALVVLAAFGLEVASPPGGPLAQLEPESLGTRFLSALEASGDLNSSALAAALRIDPTEVSRTGSRLLSLELVSRHRLGRRSLWSMTPRGREALRSLSEEGQVVEEKETRMPRPALLAWGRAASREVQRRPSPFSLRQPLQTVDLFAQMVADRHGRSELGAALCTYASVQDFSSSRELSFQVTYRPDRPAEETGWQALQERFDRRFDFESFWPSAPPVWHAQAILKGDDGRLGVLLIDVPDSPKQIANQESRLKRPDHARTAKVALREAVEAFGLPRNVIPRQPRYSDLLRRLILIHYLREHCDIQAWSARMCFLAPPNSSRLPHTPSSRDAWELVLNRSRSEASLSSASVAEWNQQHFVPVPVDP